MQLLLDFFKTIVLGIVEGITEWLPISSTGHLIIFQDLMQFENSENITENFSSMFEVVIQLGAILAVLVIFWKKLNPFTRDKTAVQKKETFSIWGKVIIGCLPAAILGFLLDDWLDEHLYNSVTVSITLIVYGILFILVEWYNSKRKPQVTSLAGMTYLTAFFIGAFQVLSLIPGTSRSGATILGAILIGCSRYVAAEYSFFLAIPVMFGASGLKIVKFLADGQTFSGEQIFILITGMIVSFIVSMFAIRFLMNFVKKHDFKIFGYYRIIIGLILIILFSLNIISV